MKGKADIVIDHGYGDAGKGKIESILAKLYAAIVRFNGANNAANSWYYNLKKIISRYIPVGTILPGKTGVIANGVAVNPLALIQEINTLRNQGYELNETNLKLSTDAVVTMPYHRILDVLEDLFKNRGTTGNGVGQVYRDKASRDDIKVKDLLDKDNLKEKIMRDKETIELLIEHYISKRLPHKKESKRLELLQKNFFKYYTNRELDLDRIVDRYARSGKILEKYMTDTRVFLNNLLDCGENVLLATAHGTGIDVTWGDDYYKTCSHCGVAGAIDGTGINHRNFRDVYIVAKVVPSRVGRGPFKTGYRQFDNIDPEEHELSLEQLSKLREKINLGQATDEEKGYYFAKLTNEKGEGSGRVRATGRLDIPMLIKSIELNGGNKIAITKLDALFGLKEFEICTHYEERAGMILPVYEKLKGFNDQNSPAVKTFIKKIEYLTNTPVTIISYGPRNEETIVK